MINIGKKICLDPLVWGSKSEKEFLETFKNGASIGVLKRAYADLPKPKKEAVSKKKDKDGSVLDSGES